jgi:hypothetical protein
MADRYATNQFYNFGKYEENIGKFNNREDTDNPKFLWPRDSIKTAANGKEGNYSAKTTAVRRGYMRMITDAYGDDLGELGNRRLHFQFNPDTLTRMVSARNDVQLWQNQDPFQFVQPIPGDANFSFELLFNREAEIASASYRDANGNIVKSNKAANLTRGVQRPAGHPSLKGKITTFEDSPFNQSWVTDIGVLADLMVFDQIIGQGMNKDLIQKITTKAQEATIKPVQELQKLIPCLISNIIKGLAGLIKDMVCALLKNVANVVSCVIDQFIGGLLNGIIDLIISGMSAVLGGLSLL